MGHLIVQIVLEDGEKLLEPNLIFEEDIAFDNIDHHTQTGWKRSFAGFWPEKHSHPNLADFHPQD